MWSRRTPQPSHPGVDRHSVVEAPEPTFEGASQQADLAGPSGGRPARQPTGVRLALEVDEALLTQLEGAARARHQAPESLAGELLALALGREAQRARAEASLTDLTPRQREVAWLAARGYTNLRIAEALVVSPETVKTHMRHVLEKLGLRAKAQLQVLLSSSPFGAIPRAGSNEERL